MRAIIVATLVATILSAPLGYAGGLRPKPGAAFPSGNPATTNNDDSCDIGTYPAATLLLPYFEVDFHSPQTTAATTVFTIVNVTHLPQIAHCTIWTDWAYPVLDFNIFLTGYDVQAISMYDVLARGIIAPPGGTSNQTTPGSLSAANNANPNFASTASQACSQLPGAIPQSLLADVQAALTTGSYSVCGTAKVGGSHANAIGYATIDVVATCSTALPTSSSYYTSQILFDNVLTGDYRQIAPNPQTGNYAGGNPLVHIRAVPEGGPPGSVPGTNLPYTFYDRFTNQVPAGTSRTIDRRQPLPSAFTARFIEGGPGSFNTNYKIWREGVTGAGADCTTYKSNGALLITEIVRFDEHEFPATFAGNIIDLSPAPTVTVVSPAASATPTSQDEFPPVISPAGDVAGWMFLNLNNRGQTCVGPSNHGPCVSAASYSAARPGFGDPNDRTQVRPSQNWAIVSMSAEGRYSVDFDATSLSNGCSPVTRLSTSAAIGPAGGVPVCPPLVTCATNPAYTGTNVTP